MTEELKKKLVQLSNDLGLPAEDLLEAAIGIIGKRGRGKSGLVKVLMEELFKVGLPFVAFDPVGIMWGLRSSLDGSGPGLPVLVVGGSHGDVRLDRRSGAETARAIVQANISCIIDFSEEPKAVYREFVKDFSHTLFAINETPRMVIIEEAPELVPQKLRPDMAAVFEAVERLVSRGRNKGIGVTLVSQRAATINKDVLTQVDALFIFGLTSPQDRRAIGEWVESKDDTERIKIFEQGIAALQKQEAWFWSPEAFGSVFKKIRIRDFRTFHPDKTHLRRAGLLQSKPVTTDVSAVVAKLGSQLERLSKEKTEIASMPKLQARIRQLEKELERAKAAPAAPVSKQEIKEAIYVAKAPLLQQIEGLRADLKKADRLVDAIERIKKTVDSVTLPEKSFSRRDVNNLEMNFQKSQAVYMPPKKAEPFRPKNEPISDPVGDGEVHLKLGARRMLKVLATRNPLLLTRAQLGTLAGLASSSGTFSDYLGVMRRGGLIEEGQHGLVRITDAGLEFAGEVPEAPTTHEEIMEMWMSKIKLGARRMLQVVADIHPESISRQELGEQSGIAFESGTFSDYLGTLRRNGLVIVEDGMVTATEALWK